MIGPMISRIETMILRRAAEGCGRRRRAVAPRFSLPSAALRCPPLPSAYMSSTDSMAPSETAISVSSDPGGRR